jgi:hypothetical protein
MWTIGISTIWRLWWTFTSALSTNLGSTTTISFKRSIWMYFRMTKDSPEEIYTKRVETQPKLAGPFDTGSVEIMINA